MTSVKNRRRVSVLVGLMFLLSLLATFGQASNFGLQHGTVATASAEEALPPGSVDPSVSCAEDPEDVDCGQPGQISSQDFSTQSVWGDLRITNVDGHDAIAICHSWKASGWTAVKQTDACSGTPAASNSGFLNPGVNTYSWKGWADTDGVRIEAGWKLREEVVGTNTTISSACGKGTFWQKVQPRYPVPGGHMTRKFYRIPC